MADSRPPRTVLSLNSGSSSLKFGLYKVSAIASEALFDGEAESLGTATSRFRLRDAAGQVLLEETAPLAGHTEACARIGKLFESGQLPAPDAVGHRVVHGGARLRHHCVIDQATLSKLEAAAVFAPLHMPAALGVIRFARERFPSIPHVACLDTAFHADLPAVSCTLPLPREWRADGIRRIGFHGLSCESIMQQLGEAAPPRVVIAHLGHGCSVTAVKHGRSIDTSMGLTPSGGLMMSTRCGDIDPGVFAYLSREKRLDAATIEHALDYRSGLLGVSSLSDDMRELRAAASTHTEAALAIHMFCYSVRKHIAFMMSALQGIDLLVFTGGIGEHDAPTRQEVCDGLHWAGIELNSSRNREGASIINSPSSPCTILILPSEEDAQIARHTWRLAS